jgi:para-nitrobenzyl esterase
MNDGRGESNRRTFLKQATVLALAAPAGLTLPLVSGGTVAAAPQERKAKRGATVETTAGKVRGERGDGVQIFRGIPYGADTSGRNRFMPPQKSQPWSGVRDAVEYGHIAPQSPPAGRIDYVRAIHWYDQPGGQGEDCLVLNVWTPDADNKKRPVLVCFHGGGFTSGSGNHRGFDGEIEAREQNVVCVSVNHRLGVLGYLHLAGIIGGDFAQSGVAGVLDLHLALEWVRDNIANFGGDPNRVMIFGQSGGGAKTTALLGMPRAEGLFHAAAVQSGSSLRLRTPEEATKTAEAILSAMGLTKARARELQDIPCEMMVAAAAALPPGNGFGPVLDGNVYTRHPFDPDAPPYSKNVPVIVSTTLDDAALGLTNFDLDMDGLKKVAQGVAGEHADRVAAAYRDAYPNATPFKLQARMLTDRGFRRGAITQAERKAAQGGAPVYMYLVTYEAPCYGGKFGAVHGVDVELVLNRYGGELTGDSPAARALADKMGTAWANFARTGDAGAEGLPEWPAYNTRSRATMIVDTECRVENDPGGELRRLWDEIRA